MPPQQGRPSLPSLPAELIEHILLCLPQEQRASCMLVCRHLAIGRGSRLLWRTASNCWPAALLAALAFNPGLHIQELRWGGFGDAPFYEFPWQGAEEVQLATQVCCQLGSRLQLLQLEVRGCDLSTEWVASLRGLRHLELYAYYGDEDECCLTLTSHLGVLPHLQSLQSVAQQLDIEADCIPPSARLHFTIGEAPAGLLAACARAAGSLRQLEVAELEDGGLEGLEWAPLAGLALTRLLLRVALPALPPELALLAGGLQSLHISKLPGGPTAQELEEPCAPLGALSALRNLYLAPAQELLHLPACLAQLPALEDLRCPAAVSLQLPGLGPAQPPAWVPRLRCLTLNLRTVAASSEPLSTATRLTYLGLGSIGTPEEPALPEASVLGVLDLLRTLPALRQIADTEHAGLADALCVSGGCVRAYGDMMQARPELKVTAKWSVFADADARPLPAGDVQVAPA
ncbi:hypothetical protein ABPG75_004448 [Micractinium tetrahymenae]